MKELRAEIVIDAPASDVWAVLTDFVEYPTWNPFITSLSGEAVEGARLDAFIRPPGQKGMRFRPRVLSAKRDRELRWLGNLIVPGLFDGEHSFRLEALDAQRTRFTQSERFTGLLLTVLAGTLDAAQSGFEQMNVALKERAIGRARPSTSSG